MSIAHRIVSILVILLCCGFFTTPAWSQRYSVHIFLLESCKITQAYTDELATLFRDYASDSITFTAWFANPTSTSATIAAFQESYGLPFRCALDSGAHRARQYGVTITPEAAVVETATQTLLYRGRINNLFVRVGQRRGAVTEHDLRSVLQALQQGSQLRPTFTSPIGCILPAWRSP